MGSLKNYLKRLDILGLSPSFNYRNNNRYTTIIGGLLSIILACLFSAYFLYSSKDIYMRMNPSLIQERKPNTYSKRVYLNPDNFPFFIALQHPSKDYNYYLDNTIFYYEAYMRVQRRSYDDNGLILWNSTRVYINLEPCDINYNFPGLEKEFNTTTYNKALCFGKNQNISINGLFQNNEFDLIHINFYECKNKTFENVICKPKNEIDQALKSTYITLGISDLLNQPYNFSFPIQKIKQEYFTSISNYAMKEVNINMKRIFYTTDVGLIFDYNEIKEYIQIDNISELYKPSMFSIYNKFLNVGIRMSVNEDFYYRKYKKFQDVMASTGGLIKFLFSICMYGLLFISKNKYLLDLLYDNYIDKELVNTNKSPINKSNILNSTINLNKTKINSTRMDIITQRDVEKKTIKNSFYNYITIFYCKNITKVDQIKFTVYSKMIYISEKCLDVNYYIMRLFELNFLKFLILDDKQSLLFNYINNHNKKNYDIDKSILNENIKDIINRNSRNDQRLLKLYNQDTIDIILNNDY